MRVRVNERGPGFYGNLRRYEGDEFEMSEAFMSKDKNGKAVLPKWVERADKPATVKFKVPLFPPAVIPETTAGVDSPAPVVAAPASPAVPGEVI